MTGLTEKILIQSLKKLGVQSGDVLFVHSDLRAFGLPHEKKSREEILQFYFDGFQSVLGPGGTLAVPAYFYEYARFGIPFDVDHSPVSSSLGLFSQWINERKDRVRSCNPLQSVAAVGKRAEELAGGDQLSGYGITSPWHRLRQMQGKFLFLGAPLQSMTYVHYIEQHYGVPHLYFKIYPYPVIKDGKTLPGKPISAVRYLEFAVEYDIGPFRTRLEQEGILRTSQIGKGAISVVDAEAAFHIGIDCLTKNPYFFLKHPPKFIEGKIPVDGITGPIS